MSIEVVPFGEEHLEEAAGMAVARYRTQRKTETSWPARFEESEVLLPLLKKVTESGPGVAALRHGRLMGFLLAYLSSFRGIRTAYSPDFGHAADADGARDLYRNMYATLSHRWLAHGCFDHAITFFTRETEAIDAWFSLGFGLIVIDALRDLDPAPGAMAEVEIRRATPEDIDLLTPLDLALRRHLAAPPIFISLIIDEGRKDSEEWLADPAKVLWLAFLNGEPVSYLRLEPSHSPVLPVSDESVVAFTGAFTREDARGSGIATCLLNRALNWALEAGYRRCSVDFESANIPGSQFWLGKDFQPVCYSLLRRVDRRLAWAHADRDQADLLRAYEGRAGLG